MVCQLGAAYPTAPKIPVSALPEGDGHSLYLQVASLKVLMG